MKYQTNAVLDVHVPLDHEHGIPRVLNEIGEEVTGVIDEEPKADALSNSTGTLEVVGLPI